MSQLKPLTTADLAQINRALVGFDRIFNDRFFSNAQHSNYPPHNIVKYSENNYGIEVAVAGFAKEDISVSVDQDRLTIRGTSTNTEDVEVEYLHRGLAARNFEQVFTLAEYMEVVGAKVENGMLQIDIKRVVPEALKPRQINIK